MELADERTHRCLKYVASVQRYGPRLTVAQFNAFAKRPSRRLSRRVPSDALKQLIRERMTDALSAFGGESSRTVPGESMLAYLYRLAWVTVEGEGEEIEDDDRVAVTDLGRAVLAALDEGSAEEEIPTTLVLDQGDPVAKGRLVGEIARAGECALVDPYFSVEDLLTILQDTGVSRVLTGSSDQPKLAALRQALGDITLNRPFEIRLSDAFHDRFVIPTDGDVLQVGTSLTGVGRRLSVMVNMGDDAAARAVRTAFEDSWSNAESLKPVPSAKAALREVPGDKETAKAEAEAAVEDVVAEATAGDTEGDEADAETDGERPKTG
jgi:hypothetical protein